MSISKQELVEVRTLLKLFAEEAYEECGNDGDEVADYMENCCDTIYSHLRDLIPQAMADYRFDNPQSERGL